MGANSSLMLVGGTVVDGTGQPRQLADVLVRDGHIAEIGTDLAAPPDAEIRDVTGRIVSPGFVDIHTHSDLTLLSAPTAISKISQGVTTEVVGNCGLGVAPVAPGVDLAALREAVSYLDLDPSVGWDWDDPAGYRTALDTARPALNVGVLAAHIPLRAAATGFELREPSRAELDVIVGLADEALAGGAVGLSTGLNVTPLMAAGDAELTALAELCARHDRLFTWHLRNYARELEASVDALLDLAHRTGCRMQVAHLTAVGQRNWPQVDRVLDRISAAIDTGDRIGIDIYPYLHGNAALSQRLPEWAQDGTPRQWAQRLREPDMRRRVLEAWEDLDLGWDEVVVSAAPPTTPREFLNRPLTEVAADQGLEAGEFVLDLLADYGNGLLMIAGGRSDDTLRRVLEHPATVVASDGLSMDPHGITGAGAPHPRSFGTFPRYLSRYLPSGPTGLEEGIARCTSRAADIVGLDRGRLVVGAPADIVVFDLATLSDRATFTEPQLTPAGIDLVVVNGAVSVDNVTGTTSGTRAGAVLAAGAAA